MSHTTPDTPSGHVLAAVDASAYGTSVADLATWAALRLDTALEFLHVIDREGARPPATDLSGSLEIDTRQSLLQELAALDAARNRLARERGRLLLDSAAKRAGELGAERVETRLRHGQLLDTLLDLQPQARLFVLGKRGEHADFARGHLGGQLERVVRAVQQPLLVASRASRPIGRVMLAFDGSPTVLKGVDMIARSPLLQGLPIRLQVAGSAGAELQARLREAEHKLSAAGYDVSSEVQAGNPETVLAEQVQATGTDLLVMGAYGHSRIRQLLVGSTTTALLRACPVPVLLLR